MRIKMQNVMILTSKSTADVLTRTYDWRYWRRRSGVRISCPRRDRSSSLGRDVTRNPAANILIKYSDHFVIAMDLC